MSRFTVLYDACVLYSAPLRDLLLWLATTDLFQAKWTAEIHEEWISNLLKKRPDLSRERLEITRQKMDANTRDCLVTGYEYLTNKLSLPDPSDRHILSAAIHSKCDAIVTFNLKDFPEDVLTTHGLEAIHPDDFIVLQMGLSAQAVCLAVKKHRASLKNPPKTVDEYFDTLMKQSLTQTVSYLREYQGLI